MIRIVNVKVREDNHIYFPKYLMEKSAGLGWVGVIRHRLTNSCKVNDFEQVTLPL